MDNMETVQYLNGALYHLKQALKTKHAKGCAYTRDEINSIIEPLQELIDETYTDEDYQE